MASEMASIVCSHFSSLISRLRSDSTRRVLILPSLSTSKALLMMALILSSEPCVHYLGTHQ